MTLEEATELGAVAQELDRHRSRRMARQSESRYATSKHPGPRNFVIYLTSPSENIEQLVW